MPTFDNPTAFQEAPSLEVTTNDEVTDAASIENKYDTTDFSVDDLIREADEHLEEPKETGLPLGNLLAEVQQPETAGAPKGVSRVLEAVNRWSARKKETINKSKQPETFTKESSMDTDYVREKVQSIVEAGASNPQFKEALQLHNLLAIRERDSQLVDESEITDLLNTLQIARSEEPAPLEEMPTTINEVKTVDTAKEVEQSRLSSSQKENLKNLLAATTGVITSEVMQHFFGISSSQRLLMASMVSVALSDGILAIADVGLVKLDKSQNKLAQRLSSIFGNVIDTVRNQRGVVNSALVGFMGAAMVDKIKDMGLPMIDSVVHADSKDVIVPTHPTDNLDQGARSLADAGHAIGGNDSGDHKLYIPLAGDHITSENDHSHTTFIPATNSGEATAVHTDTSATVDTHSVTTPPTDHLSINSTEGTPKITGEEKYTTYIPAVNSEAPVNTDHKLFIPNITNDSQSDLEHKTYIPAVGSDIGRQQNPPIFQEGVSPLLGAPTEQTVETSTAHGAASIAESANHHVQSIEVPPSDSDARHQQTESSSPQGAEGTAESANHRVQSVDSSTSDVDTRNQVIEPSDDKNTDSRVLPNESADAAVKPGHWWDKWLNPKQEPIPAPEVKTPTIAPEDARWNDDPGKVEPPVITVAEHQTNEPAQSAPSSESRIVGVGSAPGIDHVRTPNPIVSAPITEYPQSPTGEMIVDNNDRSVWNQLDAQARQLGYSGSDITKATDAVKDAIRAFNQSVDFNTIPEDTHLKEIGPMQSVADLGSTPEGYAGWTLPEDARAHLMEVATTIDPSQVEPGSAEEILAKFNTGELWAENVTQEQKKLLLELAFENK